MCERDSADTAPPSCTAAAATASSFFSFSSEQKPQQQSATDEDLVRLVIISDTHGQHHRLDPYLKNGGDVLIHCGDFANRGDLQQIRSFRQWFESQSQFAEKLVISGNHDRDLKHPDRIDLQEEFRKAVQRSITLIHDQVYACAGGRLRIFGASWETCEQDSFDQYRNVLCPSRDNDGINHEPPPIDVMLSHAPPVLRTRWTSRAWKWSKSLTDIVLQGNIPMCFCGHLHWGRGAIRVLNHHQDDTTGAAGTSVFVNCSSILSSGGRISSDVEDMDATYCAPPVVVTYSVRRRCIVRMDGPPYLQDVQISEQGTVRDGKLWNETSIVDAYSNQVT